MSHSRESNANISGIGGAVATMSTTSSANIEVPRSNPVYKFEYNLLSDCKIQDECTKAQSKILSKLETESLATNPSNKLQTLVISELVAPIDTKHPSAKVKEEVSTNLDSSPVGSGVICPTSSARTDNIRLSPVIVLERLPFDSVCLEMINPNINSSQIVDDFKNGRQKRLRNSGHRTETTLCTIPKVALKEKTRKSVSYDSLKHVQSDRKDSYVCEQCDKSFHQKSQLSKHMKTHTREKRYTCEECGKSFYWKCYLNEHMIIHTGQQSFICVQCDKSFNRKQHLNAHMGTHTREKRYTCGQCDKSFYWKCALTEHMAIHTGQMTHSCEKCGKSLYRKSSLNRHMIIHTEQKLYECKKCGKSFCDNSTLRNHLVIHTGQKLYVCEKCGKSFCHSSALKNHLVIHTGKEPFGEPHECQQGGKSLRSKSSLTKHDNSYSQKIVYM